MPQTSSQSPKDSPGNVSHRFSYILGEPVQALGGIVNALGDILEPSGAENHMSLQVVGCNPFVRYHFANFENLFRAHVAGTVFRALRRKRKR